MADTYKVTLASPLSFPAQQRVRAGIHVDKNNGYRGPLTAEQLAAIQDDEHLVVKGIVVKPTKPTDAEIAAAEAEAKAKADKEEAEAKAKQEAEAKAKALASK